MINRFEANADAALLKHILDQRITALKNLATTLLSVVDEIGGIPPLNLADGISFYGEVQRFETELIRKALWLTGNRQVQAAKMLGIKPTTLCAKIKRYNISLQKPVLKCLKN